MPMQIEIMVVYGDAVKKPMIEENDMPLCLVQSNMIC